MNIFSRKHTNGRPLRMIGAVLLFISLQVTPLFADVTITIKGDVYGGGKQGHVGTHYVDDAEETKTSVEIEDNLQTGTTTNIEINAGSVRTVFGGGENGRTFGNTQITVNGGSVGHTDWNGTIHGGLFGAGDGESAYVFGHSHVDIKGGTLVQNVYGGGNKADLMGTTNVTLQGGDIQGDVYGGARVANVYGYSFVNIDGANATNDLIIGAVYGGNDIAGEITIPTFTNSWSWISGLEPPSILSQAATQSYGIDEKWNAFVHSSAIPANSTNRIYVAQVFGGGNGDYEYTPATGGYTVDALTDRVLNSTENRWDTPASPFTVTNKPEVSYAYLELKGGNYGYVYGGGNKATVTQETVICLDNNTSDRYEFKQDKLRSLGINIDVDKTAYTFDETAGSSADYTATPVYQFDRVFGGNKQAEMYIHPKWHLERASINALYSGGDAGDMTYRDGLMLDLNSANLTVNNVYGGCRRANVTPKINGVATTPGATYGFPAGYSAHIRISAGTINNVYGGNDISGNVLGGNAIDIRSSIGGNVYGGGNGSYVYTDKSSKADDPTYGDFYYGDFDNTQNTASVAALNAFRPHTAQSYIRVAGTQANPVVVNTVYGGGNSATVTDDIKLVLGEYITIDNVFLGSNGIDMVDKSTNGTLETYRTISNLDLTNSDIFNSYMEGAAVSCMPKYSFDAGYPNTYVAANDARYAHIGSFFCGGNVGSMTSAALTDIKFDYPIIITHKLVGGCNDAFVKATENLNARHEGGFTATPARADELKIHLTVNGVIFANPDNASSGNQGNIFGGCFNSGIINGNVLIDLQQDIIPSNSTISSDMDTYLADQVNLFNTPFSVFGGGFGPEATVIGNTTINITSDEVGTGRALKVFGGGLRGGVTKNTTINMTGGEIGKIYGGGFEGAVNGNTSVYLSGGKVYDSFGGACNANISGYAQTFLGTAADGTAGSPEIKNNVFGGNDFGGSILGSNNFYNKVSEITKVYNYDSSHPENTYVTQASAYVEYISGKIGNYIFGGSCGNYNYSADSYELHKLAADDSYHNNNPYPYLASAFVNFMPNSTSSTTIAKVFGAGQGYAGATEADVKQDMMQDRSYVYVNIPDGSKKFTSTEIFGAGAFSGLGMGVNPNLTENPDFTVESVSAVIDLVHGELSTVYGGSYEEGITRRTVVNVPTGSTLIADELFGGSYGIRNSAPCDVYESNVNFNSSNAVIHEAIYGGNNNKRRTLYTRVNIWSPVYSEDGNPRNYTATIYGAGKGAGTWSQYTEINLEDGASVSEVYGGGNAGRVLNKESVAAWNTYTPDASENAGENTTATVYKSLGDFYTDNGLDNALVHPHTITVDDEEQVIKTNTNVNIKKGAYAARYCYGAGLGATATVSGTTFIGLFGGTVSRDIYAAGSSGPVMDEYGTKNFVAKTYAYIESGSVRNVYGGGWRGSVGKHDITTSSIANDIDGESNVIIGKLNVNGIYGGDPAISRNAYGGGEGGTIYGVAKVTVNNGHVGFRYEDNDYVEELNDQDVNDLDKSGNVFGGGYVINSLVDQTVVKMYGGTVRGNLYGGGEVGPIGRGNVSNTPATGGTQFINGPAHISKAGHTHVEMYGGHVMRNVFGGGRGIDSWGGDGRKFMSDEEISSSDWGCKGYVFGQTEVFIRGGEIGTTDNVAQGYGNVFGGGDLGFVYSGSGKKGEVATGNGFNSESSTEGYYYEHNGTTFKVDGDKNENKLTDDSRVIVEPYALVKADGGITIDGTTYAKGEYVPTDELDKLRNKNYDEAQWAKVSIDGIIIRNAIFAGGNVSAGSDVVYANTNTVLGNATAVLRDVYNRDLITIGTEHIGGIYGDGNLTLVDGYRELNITNYGTDYFSQPDKIDIEQYEQMTDREKAYYELKYLCVQDCTDKNGNPYEAQIDELTAEDYDKLFTGTAEQYHNEHYWVKKGFVSIYAGRLLNTIQRADFCGIFGSRMVLQGARDRVPEIVDYTDYTINRVGEVSLNQVASIAGDNTKEDKVHGNYFGIYSVVNHMGALTSDVDYYNDARQFDNQDEETYKPEFNGQTYENWKTKYYKDKRRRNNGASANKVALASGVYLELTTEESTKDNKIWGPITGVVELDLINVMTGLGGGYVYAKNIHGSRITTGLEQTILSQYNLPRTVGSTQAHQKAVTNKAFEYGTPTSSSELQTSGNFIHPQKQIVDDCYPDMNSYLDGGSPAHYWYIKGSIYVYDQYISAYTGSANAYAESVNIPLTITAQSHGKIQLKDVQPNLYAFYSNSGQTENLRDGSKKTVSVNNVTYKLNDTISYWDWYLLSAPEQNIFVPETYTTIANATIDGTPYSKGYTMLPSEYQALKTASANKTVYNVDAKTNVTFDYIFRPSNNLSHNTGFILTYDMANPIVWDKYHTRMNGTGKVNLKDYNDLTAEQKALYHEGPTYTVKTGQSGVYGQRQYEEGDIIPGAIHDTYESITNKPNNNQAIVQRAYVVTSKIVQGDKQLNPGAAVYRTQFTDTEWSSISSNVAEAYLCTSTLDLGDDEYIYYGELITDSRYNELVSVPDANYGDYFDVAWYCTTAGNYGGDYFETGKNYRGIETWSSMSEADRAHFEFNYDAFDVLIDPNYTKGNTTLYDSKEGNQEILYSQTQSIDYTATYNGTENLTYTNKANQNVTISPNRVLTREEYETIPNEQYHYSPIKVDQAGTYYIIKKGFSKGGSFYIAGKTITEEFYNGLGEQKSNIDVVTFTAAQAGVQNNTYYYCRDSYEVNENGMGHAVTSVAGSSISVTKTSGQTVPVGFILNADGYNDLPNLQKGNFSVQGTAPIGTSTLYVTRESDIFNLSKGKVITVMYQYDYEESDESGQHIEPISEQHIVNIHINFKSGVPFIDELSAPSIVLPSTTVGLKIPSITPGAYEVLGSGWEMFTTPEDADQHKNGIPYTNNQTPMYWYQDGYLVAYYTKTYLGKTYSNAVPFKVANYHRMDKVMSSTHVETTLNPDTHEPESHTVNDYMYLDEAVKEGKRNPKIYIKDASELAQFNEFFNRIKSTASNSSVSNLSNGQRLDFILDGDINLTSGWTPVGDASDCFEGTLHGDGHTISGLDHSLFGSLCGSVYNLGVTGTFTGPGIADVGSGKAVNCWVLTDGTVSSSTYPIIGYSGENDEAKVINSYYYNDYNSATLANRDTHKKDLKAFMDGEVAYNLNLFYLNKRYYDNLYKDATEAPANTTPYTAWNKADINVANAEPTTAYYPNNPTNYVENYVEQRYYNPDFIYAKGSIPEDPDIRDKGTEPYSPIWPDDYIYFGQNLTYDIVNGGGEHDVHPAVIIKSSGLLTNGISDNRVFRTPAYYQSKEKSSVYFNRYAALKDTYDNIDIHKSMTAIDFTQNNDTEWSLGTNNNAFFTPITDFDGLSSYITDGLTQNMLVYFTDNMDQNNVLLNYYHKDADLIFGFDDGYKNVRPVEQRAIDDIKGHLVRLTDNGYVSVNNHFLVDRQDFNAPISYKIPTNSYIWYQRVPSTYVESMDAGWETVSLPFTAKYVTTHQKGEITHFYQGSKTGHEYWLRNLSSVSTTTENEVTTTTAMFSAPEKDTNGGKTVNNTFLWDYYYHWNSESADNAGPDVNDDEYQKNYYKIAREYSDYPLYAAGTPYLIGFPGKRFYEFDLSGEWTVSYTATEPNGVPAQLRKQYITFASADEGTTILVTDDEYAAAARNATDGYTYMPTYQTKTLAGATTYLLSQAGDKFQNDEANSTVTTVPFRTYITSAAAGNHAPSRMGTRASALYIGYAGDSDQLIEVPVDRGLNIYADNMSIIVENQMTEAATVTIATTAGRLLKQFTVQPGTKATVPVNSRGIYIVNHKKIAVTR